ncbi:hypothetical protein [Anaerobacillus sp. 1_MG-2023]|uniref:hypothetical protein n=1 Tax=Bacillales TaxID=1385 RepID=UPI0026E17974|nr:hypothetical protein [Anaerobacillus sp. 1_MG-2023]MDO6654542.1 hypothetical protein [Anaerobacillus sp. 1_MG-2023]
MLKRLFMVLLILIVLGGCSWGSSQETYDEETIAKAEASTQNYIESNFKEIQSVTITNVYQNEMGGMAIDGTVNQGEDFTINLEDDLTVAGLAIRSDDFPPRKKGCEERVCDY